MEELIITVRDLSKQVSELKVKVDSQRESTAGLVSAWDTANGLVSFAKWIGSIAVAVAAIIAALKLWGK